MATKKKSTMTKKTASKKTKKSKISTETGRWNGHKFTVSSKLIRGFDGLQIKGSNETEDKKKSGQLYVARKNGRPAEITMTVHLNAFTGCSVRKEALAFVSEAQKGKKDYFYIGTKKLVTYKLLLTDATVKEIQIAHNHTWTSADVQLTFKQTGTGGKSVNSKSSKNSSGSQKQSVRTSSTTTTKSASGSGTTTESKNDGTTKKNALTGKETMIWLPAAAMLATGIMAKSAAKAKSYSAAKKISGSTSGTTRYTTAK